LIHQDHAAFLSHNTNNPIDSNSNDYSRNDNECIKEGVFDLLISDEDVLIEEGIDCDSCEQQSHNEHNDSSKA